MTKNKKLRWNKIVQEVSKFRDGKGKPVDRGIKEMVVVLRYLGVNTAGSCEGHLNHGIAAPWIDIESPQYKELEDRRRYALRNKKLREAYRILQKIKRLNVKEGSKLIPYLQRFYKKRNPSYLVRLNIEFWGLNYVRLQSQGAELQAVFSKKVRGSNLRVYQSEMKKFLQSLKNDVGFKRIS